MLPALVAGGFYLWGQGEAPLREVTVTDGKVTEIDLPAGFRAEDRRGLRL